jgi:4-amino-4-deoxy-L-arabinose transferase-like glycosyltransferase
MMNQRETRFIFLLTTVAFALRTFRIGSQSLWVDEIITLGKSIPKPGLGIWDYLRYNLQGPLHSFVIYCIHFLSTGDGWLRLPSAIAGAAAVYYFYRWTALWLGVPTARLATVLLAVHPLHIQYSQEVRAYGFLVFFVTFSAYHLHRMLADESRRGAAAYVLGIALAALSNFSAAFIYAVHSIFYLVRRGFTSRRLGRWAAISFAILVLISPWVYRIYVVIDVHKLVTPVKPGELSNEQRLRGETTITAAAIPYLFYVFSAGTSLGPSTRELHTRTTLLSVFRTHWLSVAWVALLFGTLAAAGVWGLARSGRWRAVQAALYIVVPLALLLALCWQNAKAFNPRYLLVSLPAFLCLIAAGIHSLPGAAKPTAAVLVFATLIFSLGNYYFDPRYEKEDVRGAARYIEENIQDGECVLAPTIADVFEHYFRKPNSVYRIGAPAGTPRAALAAKLGGVFGNCSGVWYVRSREWENDPDGEVSAALGAVYPSTETIEGFSGVELVKFERQPPD